MKRRDFLQKSSLISLPVLLNGMGVSALAKSSLFNQLSLDNDKIMVLIYLNGGNDGLNTIIPMDSYDELVNLRQEVILPESSLLTIDNDNAMNGVMTGFHNLYSEEKLSIVQGVAYPNQNRSHFRSSDIWNTASAADEILRTGWIGRYLEQDHPSYPDGYPNEENPDPLALTIAYSLSETCQGSISNFSLALANENSISSIPDAVQGDITADCYGNELQYVIESIEQLNQYSERILETYDNGNNLSTLYKDDNNLAQQLKLVAKLISGGSQTKIYILNLGGFDTHADQVNAGNTTLGNHANLLQTLSDAVEAFQDDISLLGYGNQVMGMTYSEFGRQIRSNFSYGTDHGTAAPMFLFGECVAGGTIGNNPEIDPNVEQQAGVEMQYDFRSVYASVLMDWFDVTEAKINEVLFDDFQYLPIIKDCGGPIATEDDEFANVKMELYPNPARHQMNLKIDLPADSYSLKIYSILGSEMQHVFSRKLDYGQHVIPVDVAQLLAGQYVARLASSTRTYTKRFVKI